MTKGEFCYNTVKTVGALQSGDAMDMTNRREMLGGAAAAFAAGIAPSFAMAAGKEETFLDAWQAETDLVKPEHYRHYMKTGENPEELVSLDKLESGFARVLREIPETKVGDVPAVWLVYNMGVVVKTHAALFSIDLTHRRAPELAPQLEKVRSAGGSVVVPLWGERIV